MPRTQRVDVANHIYHVLNRANARVQIFDTDEDSKLFEDILEEAVEEYEVRLLAYCLMPNHFHLVVRQRVHDGIPTFMRKLGTSYAMYYNARHGHSGTLFQGRFKSTHVDTDKYLLWLLRYVHLNSLDIHAPGWREEGVSSKARAEKFLEEYRWSSRRDYQGDLRPERSLLSLSDVYDRDEFVSEVEMVQENIKDRPLYLA